MKNVLVFYDPELNTAVEDVPVPEPKDDEVLIKVVVAGSNPKDWKYANKEKKFNTGDDAAGTVEAVGKNVKGFSKGDRVAGFHIMGNPGGTYAEYSVVPTDTLLHIPDSLSYEEAATIPLAALTATVGLYRNLLLPLPFTRFDENSKPATTPLIINGASSAVGAFAAKLASLSPTIRPIIGTAGSSADYAKKAGCDAVVDYRSATAADELRKALGGAKCYHVFDASNSLKSVEYLLPVLEKSGRYTSVTGFEGGQKEVLDKSGIWYEFMYVGSLHNNQPEGGILFGGVVSRLIELLLKEGKLQGHPYEVVPKGLAGVKDGLEKLQARSGGNAKFVYRVAETPGL